MRQARRNLVVSFPDSRSLGLRLKSRSEVARGGAVFSCRSAGWVSALWLARNRSACTRRRRYCFLASSSASFDSARRTRSRTMSGTVCESSGSFRGIEEIVSCRVSGRATYWCRHYVNRDELCSRGLGRPARSSRGILLGAACIRHQEESSNCRPGCAHPSCHEFI